MIDLINALRVAEDRFWTQVDAADCWQWMGTKNPKGYGLFTVRSERQRKTTVAHRVAFMLLVGPIPDGKQLDHLCRVRSCVNPDHVEVVTRRDNILRGYSISARLARQTQCKNGHEFTEASTYVRPDGSRRCRMCLNETHRAFRRSRKAVSDR